MSEPFLSFSYFNLVSAKLFVDNCNSIYFNGDLHGYDNVLLLVRYWYWDALQVFVILKMHEFQTLSVFISRVSQMYVLVEQLGNRQFKTV
jgi:hypothetical protein